MAVMSIRVMRVRMLKTIVPMRMRMRLTDLIARFVLVLVMFVVNMPVIVLHRFVGVGMLVTLGEMKPNSYGHEGGGARQLHR
jgi:hypothetical protein